MKTAFSLESQLDSAGPGASQNLIFSRCFEVLVLDVFLGPCFFDFYRFWARFGVPLNPFWHILTTFWGLKSTLKNEAILEAEPAAEAGPLEL